METPFECITNLTRFVCDRCDINDLTPLTDLAELTFVHFDICSIDDLTPLPGLINLTGLRINDNNLRVIGDQGLDNTGISDLALLSTLASLDSLSLDSNPIGDITSLSGLSSLNSLSLQNTASAILCRYLIYISCLSFISTITVSAI